MLHWRCRGERAGGALLVCGMFFWRTSNAGDRCCGAARLPDAPCLTLSPLYRSGHCKHLAPKWRQVAAALHGVVRVGAVNCEQQQSLCQQHGVRGYPTVRAFRWVCQWGSGAGLLRSGQGKVSAWGALAGVR